MLVSVLEVVHTVGNWDITRVLRLPLAARFGFAKASLASCLSFLFAQVEIPFAAIACSYLSKLCKTVTGLPVGTAVPKTTYHPAA